MGPYLSRLIGFQLLVVKALLSYWSLWFLGLEVGLVHSDAQQVFVGWASEKMACVLRATSSGRWSQALKYLRHCVSASPAPLLPCFWEEMWLWQKILDNFSREVK